MRYSFQNAEWRANVLLWVTVGVTTHQLVFFLFHVNPFHSWEIVPPWKSNKFPMKLSHLENQTKFQWNCPTLKIKQISNEIVPPWKSNKIPMKLSHMENQTKIQCEGHWVIVSKIKILSTPVPFVPWQSGMLLTHIPFIPWLWWQSGLTFLKYNLTLKIQGQRSRSKYPSQRSIQLTHFLSVWVILSTPVPFVPWHLGLPFPKYNLTLKVKGQGQRYPSQRSIQLSHFDSISHQGILSTPVSFVPWQSGLTFPRYKLTLKIQGQRSRSKVS